MNFLKFGDIRRGKDSSDRVGQFMLLSYIILFLLFLVLPLGALISKSLENKDGDFIGLANYNLYLQEPALFQSLIILPFTDTLLALIVDPIIFCLFIIKCPKFRLDCAPPINPIMTENIVPNIQ